MVSPGAFDGDLGDVAADGFAFGSTDAAAPGPSSVPSSVPSSGPSSGPSAVPAPVTLSSSSRREGPVRAFRRRGRVAAMWSLLGSAWKARGSRRLLLVVVLMLVLAVLAKAASVAVGSLLYSGL